MNRTPYEAAGFAFPNETMMEKALKEAEGIRYVKNSADLTEPQVVYKVYCQMVEQKLFETPVGYAFLYELQDYLWTNPSICNEDIPAIPVIVRETAPMRPRIPVKQDQPQNEQKPKIQVVRKTEVKHLDYKIKFQATRTFCIVLFLIVVGMFAVTATSGNINILNYENALIEKYENWETKLKEREEKLKEREHAAGQTSVEINTP